MRRVNPAVTHSERLRDFSVFSSAVVLIPKSPVSRGLSVPSPADGSSFAKPLQTLTIETKTPARLWVGVLR